jgi:hypothetical protein
MFHGFYNRRDNTILVWPEARLVGELWFCNYHVLPMVLLHESIQTVTSMRSRDGWAAIDLQRR